MDSRAVRAWFLIGAAAIFLWATASPSGFEDAATVDVSIDGPDGPFWNGTVVAEPAHAFGALRAASAAGGWHLEWTGTGSNVFVTQIHAWDSSGAGGWCFQVDEGAGLEDSPVSASSREVQDGWAVRWYWANACDRF